MKRVALSLLLLAGALAGAISAQTRSLCKQASRYAVSSPSPNIAG